AVAALRSGQVDAISHMETAISMLEQKGELRIVADTRTLKGTQELFGGPMPAACLYATAAYLQKNAQTAQALANAVVRALKWLQTAGPSDIIKVSPESYFLGDRGLYLASFNKVRETIALDGLIPEEGARTALRTVAALDNAFKLAEVNLARSFTNDFAKLAKKRFGA
ncbi:MAG: ABC transporter substrate-binding protein, partial [Burkholderiaceae bacterium]